MPPKAPASARLLELFADLEPVFLHSTSLSAPASDDPALSVPGAYLLAIDLPKGFSGSYRGNAFALDAGRYFYAGSAKGPGGIAARLARHFRRDKKPHWHVDQLTLSARAMEAFALPGGSECALVARLLEAGFAVPLRGFGSSDCHTCPSHLLGPDDDYWIGGS